MSRAGYKGKYGDFEVPDEIIQQLNALYMQVTVGDYDGNSRLKCASLWKELVGKSRIECQREFIKLTNKAITTYGWNPPEGWQ
uniref:ACB domain-containing protein n=1 Tax=Parascaris univalens TaxID=6257 RepID=A0A915B8M0_PARUN